MKKRFTEEQIIYRWKSKYGGMDVSEARRLLRVFQEQTGKDFEKLSHLKAHNCPGGMPMAKSWATWLL